MTKYSFVEPSEAYTDESGNPYPDILTFPLKEFKTTAEPLKYPLQENDLGRFDLVIERFYKQSYFDLLVLLLNNVDLIHRKRVLDIILIYDLNDFTTFIRRYFNGRN